MIEFLKESFALTDNGAKGLFKGIVTATIYYLVYMLPMMVIGFFLNLYFEKKELNLTLFVFLIIIVSIIMYIVTSIDYKVTYNETYKESGNLRIEIADILKKLPVEYFSKNNTSDLSQIIMSDISSIEMALSHAISRAIGYGIFLVIISVFLLIGNFKLGLVLILPLYLSIFLFLLTGKIQTMLHNKTYIREREISEEFQQAIEFASEIKSYNLKDDFVNNISNILFEKEKSQLKSNFISGTFLELAILLSKVSIFVTSVIGIRLFLEKKITIIYLIMYIISATKISESLEGLYEYMAEMFYLVNKINRIKNIRNEKIQKGEYVTFDNFDIELKNVDFSYNLENKVINNISFVAKQNEVTALIGPSGCGKSTILRLISRLYDYNNGEILVGGKNIKTIDTECLFSQISIVFQDIILFNNTILENIRIGNLNASDEEVKEAARLAGCDDIVEKLPDGFDTMIGENGIKLSGGERQRISIARAILKNAPIILLDEISASLDVENEYKIQQGLNKLIENKTVIIISHRLKSIQNVDKIVLLDNGKIDSIGNHEELYNKSKLYKSMIKKSELTEKYIY